MESDKELVLSVSVKDCVVTTFRGSGAGGQHRNKTDSAVRIVHEPSGAKGESQEQRSQLQNKRTAFLRMVDTPQFRYWLSAVSNNIKTPKEIEAEVDASMMPKNILTEVKVGKEWVKVNPDSLS